MCVCLTLCLCLSCNRPSPSSTRGLQADYVMAIDQANVVDAAAHVASTEHFHPVHMNHSRTRPNVVCVLMMMPRG